MTLTTVTGAGSSRIGNSMLRKLLFVCAALIVTLPASAAVRYVRGGFGFGPAFGPWGYWYAPYYYGGYPVVSHPHAGLVKLDTKVKNAEIFIDGAYAGTSGDLKAMWLQQGAYNLEVRSPGCAPYAQRIYVVNGKTVHVRPELRVEPNS
jgi:hypothetical protein